MAMETAETYLRSKLSAADKTKLIKDGIAQMGATLG
jgi:F0F1-type ATP synthase membrane subunit b/b'